MKKIAIIGANGRMGRLISKALIEEYDVVKIDLNNNIQEALDCDIVVDFSTGKNSAKTAIWCANNKKRLIIGATGQTDDENKIIFNASKKIPLMKSGNFSLGIALIKDMLRNLRNINIEDVTIFEKHHKNKKDRPSGTAVELCAEVEKIFGEIPQTASLRGGEEIGTHAISMYLSNEVITISHQAFSRDAFVDGVKIAIKYMLQKQKRGYYNFEKIVTKLQKQQKIFVD